MLTELLAEILSRFSLFSGALILNYAQGAQITGCRPKGALRVCGQNSTGTP